MTIFSALNVLPILATAFPELSPLHRVLLIAVLCCAEYVLEQRKRRNGRDS
jgi:hypothetical protein